jgi:lipooligosaccharide transport system ATP-binding protein
VIAQGEESVVVAQGLSKRYGDLTAVAGIDFAIPRGTCFGFLGANGAGKTSTMRMLQAVSARSSGVLSVLGLDPERDGKRVRARLGVCAQEDSLDPDLTVYDNLVVYGSYFPQSREESRARADQLLEFFALGEKRDKNIRELSGGMKRRLMIARALINNPELVILDEPTTGLDPAARHLIWQKLRELRARGVTMVLTTHYMDEAERLCDRLVIMDRGRILAEDAPRVLIQEQVGHEVVELGLANGMPEDGVATLERTLEMPLRELASERMGDTQAFFFARHSETSEALVARARAKGIPYLVRNASLEDVFLKLTGRELNE